MRDIDEILKGCRILAETGERNEFTGKITFDSRQVEEGDLFVAIRGSISDGHNFIQMATDNAAGFIMCEEFPAELLKDIKYIKVQDSHEALALAASNFYGNPSSYLKLVGVTGTNGKTTIATLLYEITESMGYKAGLLSTISVRFTGGERPATHTTPDPIQLQSSLKEMLDAGCEYVFMEVSSHAVHQKRIAGLEFDGGIFTNLTHDHLDYHKTFSEYLAAKKLFFDELPSTAFALVNADDRNSGVMLQNTKARKTKYGIKTMSDFKAKLIESHLEGNLLTIGKKELWTQLPGLFNAYNILAVYGAGILLGFPEDELLSKISQAKSVDGRFEVIKAESGVTAIVDYAHTPDALENVLKTIRGISKKSERIICVVGAGGNRDKTKRPVMARIAAELSDKVILTSDNPRFEEPEDIINDMKAGLDPLLMKKVISITDRSEAIRTSCAFAESTDIILVAGKGHETYQDIKGKKFHFDDREKLREYLNI